MFTLLALGCTPVDPPAPGLEVRPDAAGGPNAVASWPADAAERTRVEIGDDAGPWLATEWAEPGNGRRTATLLGMPADTDWTVRVVTESGAEADAVEFHAAALPVDFPVWNVTGEPGWAGWLLTTALVDPARVVILDPSGRVVWFATLPEGPVAGGRSRPRNDGLGVWWADMDEQPAELVGVSWSGRELDRASVSGLNHDYTELADGRFAWSRFDCREVDGLGRVCGNSLQVGVPGGEAEARFSTFDEFDPAVDGEVDEDGDWTHANALWVDEPGGVAWFGLRNFDAILEIDLESGAVLGQLGGPHATWAPEPGAGTRKQHRFDVLPDGHLLIHDNGEPGVGSRVVEVALDDAAGTASMVEVLRHDPPPFDYALGDVTRGADGSTLVTWSTAGMIDDFAPDGTLRATIAGELGTAFGYTTRLDALPGMVSLR